MKRAVHTPSWLSTSRLLLMLPSTASLSLENYDRGSRLWLEPSGSAATRTHMATTFGVNLGSTIGGP